MDDQKILFLGNFVIFLSIVFCCIGIYFGIQIKSKNPLFINIINFCESIFTNKINNYNSNK